MVTIKLVSCFSQLERETSYFIEFMTVFSKGSQSFPPTKLQLKVIRQVLAKGFFFFVPHKLKLILAINFFIFINNKLGMGGF